MTYPGTLTPSVLLALSRGSEFSLFIMVLYELFRHSCAPSLLSPLCWRYEFRVLYILSWLSCSLSIIDPSLEIWGRHYWGVTRTMISSTVLTITQVIAGVGIMAMVVEYKCCWSYLSINELRYSWRSMSCMTHLSSLRRNLLTVAYISVQSLYSEKKFLQNSP
jgi:hypothetical protein